MGRRFGPEETFSEDLGMFEPPHNGTTTSKAAATAIKPTSDNLRARVLDYIASCGESGAIREEVEIALEMSGSTVRPRVLELLKAGKIRELDGVTRATESGRQAVILTATR
jgi:hypothetical protein